MAGAYAHLVAVSKALTSKELEELGLSNNSLIALEENLPFISLGSISPDYPYLAVANHHTKWANTMHLDMKTKDFLLSGIEEVKKIDNEEEKNRAFAWLCGIASHIVMDVIIHPMVELKVGPYIGNEAAHRNCEMHQDAYIYFTQTGYGELSQAEHLDIFAKECSNTSNTIELNKTIFFVWNKMLEVLNKDEFETNPPQLDIWHNSFLTLVSAIEETQTKLIPLSRHIIGLDKGMIYPTFEEVNKEEYIENLKVPHNQTMHYDEIFEKSVKQIQETWKILDEAVFANKETYLNYFANWNLDNGKTPNVDLVFWA